MTVETLAQLPVGSLIEVNSSNCWKMTNKAVQMQLDELYQEAAQTLGLSALFWPPVRMAIKKSVGVYLGVTRTPGRNVWIKALLPDSGHIIIAPSSDDLETAVTLIEQPVSNV